MIFTERTVKVSNGTATIDAPVILYRGDRKIEIKFTIVDAKFKFSEGANMINSMNASYAQLAIINPNGSNAFTEIAKTEDGIVVFEITAEMIDQLDEVGFFSFHIRLYDASKESRISLPPIERGIEVKEPITSEGEVTQVVNTVGDATVGDSVVEASEEPVGDTFDENGNYNLTTWSTGDKITEGKLNKIEDALDILSQNKPVDDNIEEIIDEKIEVKLDENLDEKIEEKVDEKLNGLFEVNENPVDLSTSYPLEGKYVDKTGKAYTTNYCLAMQYVPLRDYKEFIVTASAEYDTTLMVLYDQSKALVGYDGCPRDNNNQKIVWTSERLVVADILETYPTAYYISFSSYSIKEDHLHVYGVKEALSMTFDDIIASIQGISPLKDKKWVVLGDSLTESNSRTTKNYHDYVAEETGCTVVNMGLSGSGYKKLEDTSKAFYQRISDVPTDADIITIFGSGNDLGLSLGTVEDTGTDTICGCMKQTIENLFTIMPGARLGIVLPTPWIGQQPSNKDCAMAKYCEALKEIAGYYSIPVLDLYHGSNLRPWDETFRSLYYKKDDGNGVHPDEDGHALIANKFKMFIQSL